MIIIEKTIYYYLILFAIFISSISYIPFTYYIIQEKYTGHIPYIFLIGMFISYSIYLFITIDRLYYIHIALYMIPLICLSILLFIKRKYDNKKS